MKNNNTNIIPLVPRAFRRDELEFLPAALEIIETPASPAGRAIAGAIIAFLCIALGWSVVGRVDIIATAPGRVIPTGKTKLTRLSQLKQKSLEYQGGTPKSLHYRAGAAA